MNYLLFKSTKNPMEVNIPLNLFSVYPKFQESFAKIQATPNLSRDQENEGRNAIYIDFTDVAVTAAILEILRPLALTVREKIDINYWQANKALWWNEIVKPTDIPTWQFYSSKYSISVQVAARLEYLILLVIAVESGGGSYLTPLGRVLKCPLARGFFNSDAVYHSLPTVVTPLLKPQAD